jgi:hypothetical protein
MSHPKKLLFALLTLGMVVFGLDCVTRRAPPDLPVVVEAGSDTTVTHDAPVFAAGGQFAYPIGPATVNGADAGTYPNLQFSSGVSPGDAGQFLQTIDGAVTSVTMNLDITCSTSAGGQCIVTGGQGQIEKIATDGTLTGFFSTSDGTAYCLGNSNNSTNMSALGLGYSHCSSGQVANNGYLVAWDNNTNAALINAPSGALVFQLGGAAFFSGTGWMSLIPAGGVGNLQLGETPDFGGCAGCFSFNKATTNPTSNPTNGGMLYAEHSSGHPSVVGPGGPIIDLTLGYYNPAVPGNWASTPPATVQAALDRIAANTSNAHPIP